MSSPRWRDAGGKGYLRPSTGDYLRGVTTMIRPLDTGVNALIGWATKTTAQAAIAERARWIELGSPAEAEQLIKQHAKLAQTAKRDLGTAAHDAVEAALRADLAGEARPTPIPALEPYIAALDLFMTETGWRPISLEVTVLNDRHRYAGTFDGLGTTREAGGLIMLDWKTGSIRPVTMPAQLNLYRAAPIELLDSGEEVEAVPAERLWVVQLTPDAYAVHEIEHLETEQLEQLLTALASLDELARILPESMRALPEPVRVDGKAVPE